MAGQHHKITRESFLHVGWVVGGGGVGGEG